MIRKILPLLVALGILLSACAPQGTPTTAPADIENTAIAAAWTMVAMTQAAIPTATPLPPTETPSPTPLPTFTPLPSPTLDQLILPTATPAAAVVGDCMGPVNMGEAGPQSNVRIENDSGGKITGLWLNLSTNLFGQCGVVYIQNIGKGARQTISLPKGSWWAYAWITYQNGDTSTSQGSFQMNVAFNDLVSLIVRPDSIVAK